MNQDPVVIVGAKRTPLGAFQGSLAKVPATTLGACALKGALTHQGVRTEDVSHVIMGCVLSAGVGQGPARTASLGAGLSQSVPTTLVNKVCGSSLQAIIWGMQELLLSETQANGLGGGSGGIILAGGMENMSQAPYLLPQARSGFRMGPQKALDHILTDGLEDSQSHQIMGVLAEKTAATYHLSRKVQESYAHESCTRALNARQEGLLEREITPVPCEKVMTSQDELLNRLTLDKIPSLKPAFMDGGTITHATASGFADGAAAVALSRLSKARASSLEPLAFVRGVASHGQAPECFVTAPIQAITKVTAQAGWFMEDVDLFEVNEAFAIVPLTVMQALKIPHSKMNILGGACALGHPLGTSGARIVVTLINGLHHYGLKRGVASVCIGGGEALAIAIEVPHPPTRWI